MLLPSVHLSDGVMESELWEWRCVQEFEVTPGAEDKGDQASNVSAIGGGECPGGRQAKGTMSNWLADRV